MAISGTHYSLLRLLAERGLFKRGGALLEIGKANWYGNMPYSALVKDCHDIEDDERREFVKAALQGTCDPFTVARFVYELTIRPGRILSIDMDPDAGECARIDLNDPDIKLPQDFDVAINHGTAEHIFNVANVFRVMHDAVKPGGIMIHESPFTGWLDHGFYNFQPTLFWDLADANNYKLLGAWVEHLASASFFPVTSREDLLFRKRADQVPDNAMLFVVLRKTDEDHFKVPQQGVYAGTIGAAAAVAWKELR